MSRKDQSNKKKLSPLTNHKSTKNGVIKGGFDRVNLFQQAEQEFDKLFGYNRQRSESFDYYNTMKNGSISQQIESQEQSFTNKKEYKEFQPIERKTEISKKNNQKNDSVISIIMPRTDFSSSLEEHIPIQKRKKKKRWKI